MVVFDEGIGVIAAITVCLKMYECDIESKIFVDLEYEIWSVIQIRFRKQNTADKK